MPLRKESKRCLIALVALAGIGLATFATVSSSSAFRSYAKEALASRSKQAR